MADIYSSSRIVKNTLLLYGRMLVTMWLNLWTTRLVLQNLGVDDMGVYSVVGSLVTMFTVFTGGIVTAVQRYVTFELGSGDEESVGRVFGTSVGVLLLLSAVLLVLLEALGVPVMLGYINIPEASREAAQWVFQLSVVTCLAGLVTIPYQALVVAHERMNAFASISILQVSLTCAACYGLGYIASGRLVWYALFMTPITLAVRGIYVGYCWGQFSEARHPIAIDRSRLADMGRFTGITSLSGVFQVVWAHGITLVINWTFGVALNAVYSIALQLKNMVLSFSLNFFKAIQPQITKTYAAGEWTMHGRLVYSGSKLEVFLVYFLLIPFLFRTEYIMRLWLGEVPAHAVWFCQCSIFLSLTYSAFEPIRTAVLATGRIARFMLIPDALALLALPVGYGVARLTGLEWLFMCSIVAIDVLCCVVRVVLGAQVSAIKVGAVVRQVVWPCVVVAGFGALVCYGLTLVTDESLAGLAVLLAVHTLALSGVIYAMGLNQIEKSLLWKIVRRRWI